MPKDFRGGSTIEEVEARKKQALEEIAEMDQEIERLKAEEELKRSIDVRGLYNRVDSLIQTSRSSMSDVSLGEVHEVVWDNFCADEYSRTIDIEIGGRYRDDEGRVYNTPLGNLTKSYEEGLTLVVSYLIPFNLIKEDPFFQKKK